MGQYNANISIVVSRYARSALEAAGVDAAAVSLDMQALDAACQAYPALSIALGEHNIPNHEKIATLEAILTKVKAPKRKETLNLLQLLARNNRLGLIDAIARKTQELHAALEGRKQAHVYTATPLNAAQEKLLRETLRKTLGADVSLSIEVQENLLAGLQVKIDSVLYDATLQGKLESIHSLLRNQN